MQKAIFSRIDLDGSSRTAEDYMSCVKDIIKNSKVQKLTDHYQHCNTSRLQHSINVSYYSFIICRRMGWDKSAAARAGLLHDLYFYNWRNKNGFRKSSHASWHPRVAKDNARKICVLKPVEEDAILKHMWPMTIKPPRYKESYVVCMTDKVCALFEFMGGQGRRFKAKFSH